MNTEWLDRTFGFEGVDSDDPDDPGKRTRYGISQRAYPNVNIATLTKEQAAEIYAKDYARPFLDLHPALGYQMFDFAVNVGVDRAVRKLQLVLGVTVDGKLGPMTRAAIKDVHTVCVELLAERLEYYTDIQGWQKYGRGWARRVADNMRYLTEDLM